MSRPVRSFVRSRVAVRLAVVTLLLTCTGPPGFSRAADPAGNNLVNYR